MKDLLAVDWREEDLARLRQVARPTDRALLEVKRSILRKLSGKLRSFPAQWQEQASHS